MRYAQPKNKEIIVPILNNEYKVIVLWGNKTYIEKKLKSWHYPKDRLWTLENRRGVCLWHSGCHPSIVLSKPPIDNEMIGTLAHEAVHAIDYIFSAIEETKSEEIFAHSVGAVVREVVGSLKYKK